MIRLPNHKRFLSVQMIMYDRRILCKSTSKMLSLRAESPCQWHWQVHEAMLVFVDNALRPACNYRLKAHNACYK